MKSSRIKATRKSTSQLAALAPPHGMAHTVPDHPKNLLYSGPVVLILFRQLRRYGLAMLLLKPLNIMLGKVEKHIYWTLVRIWPVLTEQRQGRNQG